MVYVLVTPPKFHVTSFWEKEMTCGFFLKNNLSYFLSSSYPRSAARQSFLLEQHTLSPELDKEKNIRILSNAFSAHITLSGTYESTNKYYH